MMFTLLGLIIEILILSLFKIDNSNNILAIVSIFLIFVCYVVDCVLDKSNRKYAWILICGFALRILLLCFDIFCKDIYVLPGSGSDSEAFYSDALLYVSGSSVTFRFGSDMGLVMKIIGTSRLYSQFLLTMCGVVTLNILLKICRNIKLQHKYVVIVMCLGAFLPNYAILSSIFLRESLISMFIALSILMFIKWFNTDNVLYFVPTFIFDLFATYFHSGCIALFIGYILIIMLYDNKNKHFKFSFKGICFASLFLLAFVYVYNNYGDTFFSYFGNRTDSIETIGASSTNGGSNYIAYVGNSDTVFNFIIYTPLRMIYFTFSPFIWQWRGLSDIIAFVFNALVAIITFVEVVRAIPKQGKYHNLIIALFILWLCGLFVYSWGTTTTGTAVRHRDKFIAIELVLLICSISDIESKKRKLYGSKN